MTPTTPREDEVRTALLRRLCEEAYYYGRKTLDYRMRYVHLQESFTEALRKLQALKSEGAPMTPTARTALREEERR
jgi:hypothetical protein